VRHLRILALCLAAVFALTATTLVIASPALASCNEECKLQKEKEKQEKKEKIKQEKEEAKLKKEEEKLLKKHPEGQWEKFDECPFGASVTFEGEPREISGCIYGYAGSESFFQAGKVTVDFKKPVALQLGFYGALNPETESFPVAGARNGDTIAKEAEPAPSLTEVINPELLPEAEKKRYEEYLAGGGSTKATETIELAVPAKDIFLNEDNLIKEEGKGFEFSVMIHIENKFLGTACYDGSTEAPIEVPFTTGETHPEPPNTPIHGFLGKLSTSKLSENRILQIEGQRLVNNEYAAPGVSECGIHGGANAALDAGLGLPSPAGSNTTLLVGNLYQASVSAVEEHLFS
jgi:hypothetical protein